MSTPRRHRTRTSRFLLVLCILVVLIGLATQVVQRHRGQAAAQHATVSSVSGSSPSPHTSVIRASRVEDAGVTIADAASDIPAYDRTKDFGAAWKDATSANLGHNGCDTRNDILARDLTDTTMQSGSDCVVATGTLNDPYTGTTIHWVRGPQSSTVQIDHIVPLSWAWGHGAASWSQDLREQYANDPLNLQAADGPSNAAKGDSGPADWMPANTLDACTYAQQFVTVLATYHLTVDQADATALDTALATCS